MERFKIRYLPLAKVNRVNETLEAARKNAKEYLQRFSGVEVIGGRLQNNSFCAANMNSRFMCRMHVPCFHIHAKAGTAPA